MAEQPLFSVVIPAFNRARFLPDALDSVFAQGIEGAQVIVVDDGSTDDTREVVTRYGRGVLYAWQRHAGAAAARNRGIGLAAGTYVSFLDSDDVWLSGKMELELSLFASLPEADAVVTDAEFWELGAIYVASRFADRGLRLPAGRPTLFPPGDPALPWLDGSLFATCCLTLRRSSLGKLGALPFDTRFEGYEDWELEIRMFLSCSVAFYPRLLARVRRFDDGTRVGAPPLGEEPTPGQRLRGLYGKHRMLEQILALPQLPPSRAGEVRSAIAAAAAEIVGLEAAGVQGT
jgi:glycosyltransferase involved in cell wall biosynthesis